MAKRVTLKVPTRFGPEERALIAQLNTTLNDIYAEIARITANGTIAENMKLVSAGGVYSGGVVAAQSTPDQSITVSLCEFLSPDGKRYIVPADSNLSATAAHSTNPRIDIVYFTAAGIPIYYAGVAAGSPVQPDTPAGGTLLAAIARAAGDNTISSGDITDQRTIIP